MLLEVRCGRCNFTRREEVESIEEANHSQAMSDAETHRIRLQHLVDVRIRAAEEIPWEMGTELEIA